MGYVVPGLREMADAKCGETICSPMCLELPLRPGSSSSSSDAQAATPPVGGGGGNSSRIRNSSGAGGGGGGSGRGASDGVAGVGTNNDSESSSSSSSKQQYFEPLPGFAPAKAMVFASIYPTDEQAGAFEAVQIGVSKLLLTDPSVSTQREFSKALVGVGRACV